MLRKDIEEKFPFLSVVTYGGNEYIGIINNQDAFITSMYVYTDLRSDVDKAKFVQLGEDWWWESNRMIPINIFLSREIYPFKYAIRNFTSKDVQVILGPVTSLNAIITKRIKRKSITLVRKPSS